MSNSEKEQGTPYLMYAVANRPYAEKCLGEEGGSIALYFDPVDANEKKDRKNKRLGENYYKVFKVLINFVQNHGDA